MARRPLIPATIAALLVAGFAWGQTPPADHQHDHGATTTPETTQDKKPQPLILGGCLMRQKDAASGYVLVAAHPMSHHRNLAGMSAPPAAQHAAHPPDQADKAPATTTAPAAQIAASNERIADSAMFVLRGLPPDQLAKLNGKHVVVAGQIDAATVVDDSKLRPAGGLSAPTFIATSIEPADGACPKR